MTMAEYAVLDLKGREAVEACCAYALKNAASIELVNLNGSENYGPPKRDPGKEYFNWWVVTNRRKLTADECKLMVERLGAEIGGNHRKVWANCFEPEHALRVQTVDGGRFDIIICFHCRQLWCFDISGERIGTQTGISQDLLPFFDSLIQTSAK